MIFNKAEVDCMQNNSMTTYIPARLISRYGSKEGWTFHALAERVLQDCGDSPEIILVVAPYGSGKTRFCEELSLYGASKEVIVSTFRGKDFVDGGINVQQISSSSDKPSKITIVDALDELPHTSILSDIIEEIQNCVGNVVLTCRTTLLDTMLEQLWEGEYRPALNDFLGSYNITLFDLQAFTEDDAILYLTSANIPEATINSLTKAPIWSTLSAHPLWLNILVQAYDSNDDVIATDLWSLLKGHIDQVIRKSPLLSDLLFFAFQDTAIAQAFGLQIKYDDLAGIDREYWTLIEKTGEGIAFKNRIFFDYFLVSYIAQEIAGGMCDVSSRVLLSDIQIQLLSSALPQYGFQELKSFLEKKKRKIETVTTDYLGTNFIHLFRQRGYSIEQLLCIYDDFPSADMRGAKVTDVKLTDIDFKNAMLGGASIQNSSFHSCNFEGTDFGDKIGFIDLSASGSRFCCITHTSSVMLCSYNCKIEVELERVIDGATACCLLDQGVVIGFQDGTVQIFDAKLQPISVAEPVHTDKVMDIVADANIISSCSCDGTVGIWDRRRNKYKSYQVHNDLCHGLDVNTTTESIISVGYDGLLVIISYVSGQIIVKEKLSYKSLYSCKFSPDGKRIVVGGFGATLKVLDAVTLKEVHSPVVDDDNTLWCVEWIDNENYVTSGWSDSLIVYSYGTDGAKSIEFNCYNSKVVKVGDGLIVTSAVDRKLAYVDIAAEKEIDSIQLNSELSISFENVLLEKCFGLSPTRNMILSECGAEIKHPIPVTSKKFNRKTSWLNFRKKKTLKNAPSLFNELYEREKGVWVFPAELNDTRSQIAMAQDLAIELFEQLQLEGYPDKILLAELQQLVENEKSLSDASPLDLERLLQRLASIQGASSLVGGISRRLVELITALMSAG